MSEHTESRPKAEAFAARAAARLEEAQPAATPLNQLDPTWIALFVAILRILILLLSSKSSSPTPEMIAQLRAPMWWQIRALFLRRRVLTRARRLIEEARAERTRSPGLARAVSDDSLTVPCVDAVIDEASTCTRRQLDELAREYSP